MSLKDIVKSSIKQIPGWRTNHKIVVIESDDWGSVRMPSREVYVKLLKAGIRVDQCPYNRYDSLASEDDLLALFEVLKKFRDKNGQHPVITANSLVANPDFSKIKDGGFKQYFFEPFTQTLDRYPKHQNSFKIWKEGMSDGIFYPQFHGREHLNINRWLRFLQNGSGETLFAFENELFGISTTITKENRPSYLSAMDFDDPSELVSQKEILTVGLELFEKIFGFQSVSYIATNYTWHPSLESTLSANGVKFLQGAGSQRQPDVNGKKIIRHSLGQRNQTGQTYLIRNGLFEPSLNEKKDWVASCLKEINLAFFWNKPAIISSHRLNFIGFIDESNRTRNLRYLETILRTIVKKWPEVEFFTTEELGNTIIKKDI